MRILVFTDSHGRTDYLELALLMHPEADLIVHLGDYERDMEDMSVFTGGKRVVRVCGNCDYASALPANELLTCGGKRILCTHGYMEYVKHGEEALIAKAADVRADIVLYGHTHQSVNRYEDGLYIFNPGAMCDRCFGVVDITPGGIICIPMEV